MQISAYSGKARIFVDGKWSAWMDRNEAQKLEAAQWKGAKIMPLVIAQHLGEVPSKKGKK